MRPSLDNERSLLTYVNAAKSSVEGVQSNPKEVRPPSEEVRPPLKGASHPMKEVGPGLKDEGPLNLLRLHLKDTRRSWKIAGHPRKNAKPSLKDTRRPSHNELITKTTNIRFPKKIEKPITSTSSSPSSLIPQLEGELMPAKPDPETKTTAEPESISDIIPPDIKKTLCSVFVELFYLSSENSWKSGRFLCLFSK